MQFFTKTILQFGISVILLSNPTEGCSQKLTSELKSILNAPKDYSGKINYNGYYEKVRLRVRADSQVYYWPMFFFADNTFVMFESGTSRQILIPTKAEKYFYSKEATDWTGVTWGVYEISNDTVTAHAYIRVRNTFILPIWKKRLTHFQGKITSDAIEDWHVIDPKPKVTAWDSTLITRHEYWQFQKSELAQQIDPSRSWLHKK